MERSTRQRALIAGLLDRADRPLSVAELLALGRAELPGLGQATVYRALRELIAAGELQTVEIPGAATTYERAHHHHHHFRCRGCERVFEVEGCPPGIPALTPAGFVLESHEVVLHGLCAGCAHAQPGANRAR